MQTETPLKSLEFSLVRTKSELTTPGYLISLMLGQAFPAASDHAKFATVHQHGQSGHRRGCFSPFFYTGRSFCGPQGKGQLNL